MITLLMSLVNTNPYNGPIWFGAISDFFIVLMIVYMCVISRKNKNNE